MNYFIIWTAALIAALISSYMSVKTYGVTVKQSLIVNFLTIFIGLGGCTTLVHLLTAVDG
ncbi:TMhelix containing protein [Vibrio phage 1.023.O._10N.222.51.B4]|nr:TMhelix containing protein [Vibrio phage 1.023.O._10N.222.51.B4]